MRTIPAKMKTKLIIGPGNPKIWKRMISILMSCLNKKN